ncbi:hypothetical protein M407DRAFT_212653, partial [Tulasnella calospora MUT 4182]
RFWKIVDWRFRRYDEKNVNVDHRRVLSLVCSAEETPLLSAISATPASAMDEIIQTIRMGDIASKHYRDLQIYIKQIDPKADVDVWHALGGCVADMIHRINGLLKSKLNLVEMVDTDIRRPDPFSIIAAADTEMNEESKVDRSLSLDRDQPQAEVLPDKLKHLRECTDRILCEDHDVPNELWHPDELTSVLKLDYLKEIRHFIGPNSRAPFMNETNDLVKELAADIYDLHECLVSLDCGSNSSFRSKVERYRREASFPVSLIAALRERNS